MVKRSPRLCPYCRPRSAHTHSNQLLVRVLSTTVNPDCKQRSSNLLAVSRVFP